MTLCDTCALACDERKGWEVLYKCGATGELRPLPSKEMQKLRKDKKSETIHRQRRFSSGDKEKKKTCIRPYFVR